MVPDLLYSFCPEGFTPYSHMCCIYFSYRYIIPIFVWFLTCCIVFALKYVQPVVSVLTFFKGSLLLGTVSNNWTMSRESLSLGASD